MKLRRRLVRKRRTTLLQRVVRKGRRKSSGAGRIRSSITSPTASKCIIGRQVRLNDKIMAVVEFNDNIGYNFYSGATPPSMVVADITSTASNIDGQYLQASSGVDWTNLTAMSGCQCVFHYIINNVNQLYTGSNNWFAKLPIAGNTNINQQSQPFILADTNLQLSITNTTNIYAEMKIYDYIYRKDAPAVATIFNMWNGGLVRTNIAGTTQNVFPWTIRTTPFDSQELCQFVKIVKTSSVFLGPGATHSHLHKNNCGKTIYPTRFQVTTGYLAGITSGCIVVVQGQPVEATAGSIGAVTTGIVDLNVVANMKATLGQNFNNKTVYSPSTATSFYQANQTTGAFKALIDNSRVWSLEVEGA